MYKENVDNYIVFLCSERTKIKSLKQVKLSKVVLVISVAWVDTERTKDAYNGH
jgi:hypothetical protein